MTWTKWPEDVRDFMLDRLGLEQKDPTSMVLGGLAVFTLGIIVGSALGMFFAPKTGTGFQTVMNEKAAKADQSRVTPSA